MDWLERQCALGPRVPGSAANRRLRELIAETARGLGLRVQLDPFEADLQSGVGRVLLCNVVVSIGDDPQGRLWLGAHFDTRPVSDLDPDPARRALPLIGANDGASGTAVLLHLMELLGRVPPPRGVDLLFFDGEDAGAAGSPDGFCLGSRRLAASCRDFGSPLAAGTPRGLVLLDMVGDRDLLILQEQYSRALAPEWTDVVFARAAELGLDAFAAAPGPAVFDDHVPFLQAGIPAVDLIDFDYPPWHTTGDVPGACAAAGLEQVGRLLVDLVYGP